MVCAATATAVALVTGCTVGGIGLETAIGLAKLPNNVVYIACRDAFKITEVAHLKGTPTLPQTSSVLTNR